MTNQTSVWHAAAVGIFLTAGAATADEGKEVPCAEIDMEFNAPGFEAECKDYSRASVSVDEMSAATKTVAMFAISRTEVTFINAAKNFVLGGTRFYFNRRSLESDIEAHFTPKFSHWKTVDDIGDYEIREVDASFDEDDAMECVAFRKLGARRMEGVAGMTLGYACSGKSRDRAYDTVKVFVGATD